MMHTIRAVRGFTLVEMLVVAAVIVTLVSIVWFNVGEVRAKSRDKARVSDLKQLELALALYRERSGSYPAALSSLTPTFIAAVPVDPRNTSPYVYTYSLSGGEFTITARFESRNNRCYVKSQGASAPSGTPTAIPCENI